MSGEADTTTSSARIEWPDVDDDLLHGPHAADLIRLRDLLQGVLVKCLPYRNGDFPEKLQANFTILIDELYDLYARAAIGDDPFYRIKCNIDAWNQAFVSPQHSPADETHASKVRNKGESVEQQYIAGPK